MALTHWMNAMEWLAAAARDPRACKNDWQHGSTGVHLLAAGRLWDVLVVPACLGLRTADILDGLPLLEPGPALLDSRRRQVGFFLPPDPASIWSGPDVRYVTQGGWIATPAPHCRWGDLRWLCPPDGTGTLNTPEVMELALARAVGELARAHGAAHCHTPHRRRSLPSPSAAPPA
ncbi:hypothetical protein [Streptomyces sp. P17]|uniref:hypothetical protein n=1 Tax=Streptomyces sp. P17 TaxID=3074716 RepID=UPI0028F447D0|nr:hypothetical protein [Streptomyces sp. P17]MDT9700957.1 hypothetical protein [Streptomyces sp. P17]